MTNARPGERARRQVRLGGHALRCLCAYLVAYLAAVLSPGQGGWVWGWGLGSPTHAAVIEPNGVSVPAPVPAGEVSLQAYFDMQMEAINAVANAAAEPGVFLPLCDFAATLVLNQSQGKAGIAWYNVPATPTGAPAAVTMIVPPGTPVGQTVTSADVRTNPLYAQGLIGFALMRDGVPVYYSEYQRNALCSGCVMPGYWRMALAYQSVRFPNTYYLGFEDWPGADQMSWQGNDGDFNDQVFRISGVTCEGGGEPCDTTKPGVCSTGRTECQAGGNIICRQQIPDGPETCDNLDNDCDGQVDNGMNLCPAGSTCVAGTCIPECGRSEFDCAPGFLCTNGLCIHAGCVNKACSVGQVCRLGACVGGCEGVICPLGQDCQLGVCVDLCASVQCPGSVCDRGVCVTHCRCRTCDPGMACAGDGSCVDDGCQSMNCGAGQVCRKGGCTDACAGAICPGGAACRNGLCDPPETGRAMGGASGTTNPGTGGAPRGTGGSGAGTGGSSGARDAAAADGTSGGTPSGVVKPGCGCQVVVDVSGAGAIVTLVLPLLARRRRRSPR